MKEIRPDEWRRELAREFQEQSATATLQIGKQLQFKLAKITLEPLPSELQLLLGELDAKTAQKNGPSPMQEREAGNCMEGNQLLSSQL